MPMNGLVSVHLFAVVKIAHPEIAGPSPYILSIASSVIYRESSRAHGPTSDGIFAFAHRFYV